MIKKIHEKYLYYHEYVPKLLVDNQHYLIPGTYRVDSFGELVNHSSEKSTISSTLWGIKSLNWYKRIIRKVFVKLFSVKVILNGGDLFSGKTLKSSEDGMVKIFDSEEKKVLTILPSHEITCELENNHDYFARYFHTSNIMQIDRKITLEDYIEPEDIDVLKKFDLLLASYDHYFKKLKLNGDISNDYHKLSHDKELKTSKLSDIVLLRCHGDCWSSNIIYSENKLFMIDFDRNGQFFFLYDIMTYMYCEAVYNNDSSILDNFIVGCYDQNIIEFYSTFDIEWNGSKKEILEKFSEVYFNERLTHSKKKEQTQFNDFIDKIFTRL